MHDAQPLFLDRRDAGRQLAAQLIRFRPLDTVVLALPRGGVAVGIEVAKALDAPLDLLLVRALGAPADAGFGVGAVIGGSPPRRVLNENWVGPTGTDIDYLELETRRQLAELKRQRKRYLGDRPPVPVAGRTVIVVDDGLASGGTLRAALRGLADREPSRLVLAVPVAAPRALDEIAGAAEIVHLAAPASFHATAAHYDDFSPVTDDEVVALLREATRWSTAELNQAVSPGTRRRHG